MINVWNFLFVDRCLFLFYWFTDHVLQFHLQDQAFFIFGFLFNDSWMLQNSIQSCIWCSGYLSWITVELGFQSHLCPFGILQDLLCWRPIQAVINSKFPVYYRSVSIFPIMSFVFRGTRGDIESGFPGFIAEQPAVVSLCVVVYSGAVSQIYVFRLWNGWPCLSLCLFFFLPLSAYPCNSTS